MKKVINLLFVLGIFLFPVKGFSQGIYSGQSLVTVYGGVGTALEKSGMELDGKRISWGNIGGEMGLSYLYFPTPFLGLGVDVHYAGFQGSDTLEYLEGRHHWHTFETDFEMHTLQLMAAGRVNLNPNSYVRFYIPFGAGLVLSEGEIKYRWDDYPCETEDYDYDASFGWYAGLGVEFPAGDSRSWGLEARYNAFRYDDGLLAADVGGDIVGKTSNHSYLSFVFTYKW